MKNHKNKFTAAQIAAMTQNGYMHPVCPFCGDSMVRWHVDVGAGMVQHAWMCNCETMDDYQHSEISSAWDDLEWALVLAEHERADANTSIARRAIAETLRTAFRKLDMVFHSRWLSQGQSQTEPETTNGKDYRQCTIYPRRLV